MGAHSGPNSIESGLVFAYDMGNTLNSWKGLPTTNLNTLQSLNGMSGISLTYIGIENGWKKYGISGTWASGTYPFSLNISDTTLSGTIAYSAQVTIKTNVRSKFLTFGGLNYVNDPNMVSGGTSTVTSLGNDRDGFEMILSKREGFIYSAGYANPTTIQPGYINSRPTADGVSFNSSTDFVWVRNIQVEQRTFCTPYVSGTRSNTQAILDWARRNTVTVNTLTYSTNNTFQFNGSSDFFTIPNINFSTGQTIEIWLKPTESDTNRRNPYNQSYGGHGTWTHETSGSFNYYYGDAGADAEPYIGHTSGFTVLQNELACVCSTRNLTTSVWYKNGVQDTTFTHSYGELLTDTNPIKIGSGYAGSYLGDIYAVKLYNRALTATEVRQNFTALRNRFGL